MKILPILFVALSLSLGYVLPAVSAPTDIPAAQQEPQKRLRPAPRFHRGMSKAMMKDLNLSAEQKAQWKEISAQKNKELRPLREQAKTLHEQERQISEKYEAQIKKILTEEQLKKYESMLPKRPNDKPRRPKKQ